MGLLTSPANAHHGMHPGFNLPTWSGNNNNLGASQSTIESTTFAHKYRKPKAKEGGDEKRGDGTETSTETSTESGTEASKTEEESSQRSVDDKCTICLCEYENEENVR